MKKKYAFMGLAVAIILIVTACALIKFSPKNEVSSEKTGQEAYMDGDVDPEEGELPILPAESNDNSSGQGSEVSDKADQKESGQKKEGAQDSKPEESKKPREPEKPEDPESKEPETKGDGAVELPFVPYRKNSEE